MRLLYTLLFWLALPLILFRLTLRGFQNPSYFHRWRERFGFGAGDISADIWIHAVSMGEVNAAAPLAAALADKYPDATILVTTMTPTGSEQVFNAMRDDVRHEYLPYDYPFAVRRFLNRAQPRLAVIMETEIWPNLITECNKRQIPVSIVNLRLSERSWRGYRKAHALIRSTLSRVNVFAVQSSDDARRLLDLGADPEHVHITGSIKFEIKQPASLREIAEVLGRQLGSDRRIIVAGSTHDPEEEILLAAFRRIHERFPDTLLVLVPRHPERFDMVARLTRRMGFVTARRSESSTPVGSEIEVYVADTMGELPVFYAASDIAFVGGSLAKIGGHNILEACAAGVAVVFGPHMFNFKQVSEITVEKKAGVSIRDGEEFFAVVCDLLQDANLRSMLGENGIRMIDENRGALKRTMSILPALKQE